MRCKFNLARLQADRVFCNDFLNLSDSFEKQKKKQWSTRKKKLLSPFFFFCGFSDLFLFPAWKLCESLVLTENAACQLDVGLDWWATGSRTSAETWPVQQPWINHFAQLSLKTTKPDDFMVLMAAFWEWIWYCRRITVSLSAWFQCLSWLTQVAL